jgi:predicted metal-dependent hydrolase
MASLRGLLFGEPLKASPRPLPDVMHELDGRHVRVSLKRHAKAKRMVLRLQRDGSSFVLTLPPRQSLAAANGFVAASADWMRKTLARQATPLAIADAAEISLRGQPYVIRATGKARGLVTIDDETKILHVPGSEAHLKRRLTDWLKKQAEADLLLASRHYATAMQTQFQRLTVRDQKSRWGSCSSDKTLSYSWRLIMAPTMVLDYVAAHEVAHLLEMNHSQRFRRLVLTHCKHAGEAKRWLKAHGQSLHRLA